MYVCDALTYSPPEPRFTTGPASAVGVNAPSSESTVSVWSVAPPFASVSVRPAWDPSEAVLPNPSAPPLKTISPAPPLATLTFSTVSVPPFSTAVPFQPVAAASWRPRDPICSTVPPFSSKTGAATAAGAAALPKQIPVSEFGPLTVIVPPFTMNRARDVESRKVPVIDASQMPAHEIVSTSAPIVNVETSPSGAVADVPLLRPTVNQSSATTLPLFTRMCPAVSAPVWVVQPPASTAP